MSDETRMGMTDSAIQPRGLAEGSSRWGRMLAVWAVLTLTVGCGDDDAASTSSPEPQGGAGGEPVAGGTGGAGGGDGGMGGSGGTLDPACAELLDALKPKLDQARADIDTPGAFLGIRTPECDGLTVVSGEAAEGEPLTEQHLFRIGSVTKTFIAAGVLALQEDGALSLSDAASSWVPAIDDPLITVEQLLNHTSGLFNYTEDGPFMNSLFDDPLTPVAPEELLEVGLAHDPYFAAGEGWHYSNTNYIALGLILEAASEQPLDVFLRERFLDPQGLSATTMDGERELAGPLAHGYLASGGADLTFYFDQSWAWAAGAMVSSAADLVRWSDRLYGGDVLAPSSLASMETVVDTGVASIGYGLGMFRIDPPAAPATMYGHSGDTFGYHTQMYTMPEEGITVVAATTSDNANPNDLSLVAMSELFPNWP